LRRRWGLGLGAADREVSLKAGKGGGVEVPAEAAGRDPEVVVGGVAGPLDEEAAAGAGTSRVEESLDEEVLLVVEKLRRRGLAEGDGVGGS